MASAVLPRIVGLVRRLIPDANAHRVERWIDRGAGECTDRFWALDPIDGTRGLVRGDRFAIALALVVDGRPEVAVLGCPRLSLGALPGAEGCIVLGVRGGGVWGAALAGAPWVQLSVSGVRDPRAARLLRSFEERHTDVALFEAAARTLGAITSPVLMDSQAKYPVLAAGDADLLLRFPSSPGFHDAIWDLAAGSLILTEAGGCVTDLHGTAFDFGAGRRLVHNQGVVASNRRLHDAALAAVRRT